MSIPILGKGKAGVADLRSPEEREPHNVAEWINHPQNAGMKDFILITRKNLRRVQAQGAPIGVDDVCIGYLAGFLSGMTLIQGIFLGSSAFGMAEEAYDAMPAEDPPDPVEGEENVAGQPETSDGVDSVPAGDSGTASDEPESGS